MEWLIELWKEIINTSVVGQGFLMFGLVVFILAAVKDPDHLVIFYGGLAAIVMLPAFIFCSPGLALGGIMAYGLTTALLN